MAEIKKFTRVPDAPKAEPAKPEMTPKVHRPHSVVRETSSVVSHLVVFVAGAIFATVILGFGIPMSSEIIARGVAIGAARAGQ